MKNYASGEKCDSSAWWISTQKYSLTFLERGPLKAPPANPRT